MEALCLDSSPSKNTQMAQSHQRYGWQGKSSSCLERSKRKAHFDLACDRFSEAEGPPISQPWGLGQGLASPIQFTLEPKFPLTFGACMGEG